MLFCAEFTENIIRYLDTAGEGKPGTRWLTFTEFVTKKRVGVSLTSRTEYAKNMHESPYKFEIGGWIYAENVKPDFHIFSSTTLYFDCNGDFDESGVAEETFLKKEDRDRLLFLFHTHAGEKYPPWLSYFDLCTTLDRAKYGEPQADIVFNDNEVGRAFILKEGADLKDLIGLMKKFEIGHKNCTEKEKHDFFMQHAGRFFIMYDIVLSPEGVEVSHVKSNSGGVGRMVDKNLHLNTSADAILLVPATYQAITSSA